MGPGPGAAPGPGVPGMPQGLGGAAPGQLKQFGPPTPGSPTGREGESFTGQISVMEHVKSAGAGADAARRSSAETSPMLRNNT